MSFYYRAIKFLLLISLFILASCETRVVGDTGISLDDLASKLRKIASEFNPDDISYSSYKDADGNLVVDFKWEDFPYSEYYRVYMDSDEVGANQELISEEVTPVEGQKEVVFNTQLKTREDKFERTYYYWIEVCVSNIGCVKMKTPKKVAWNTEEPKKLAAKLTEKINSKIKDIKLSWENTSSSEFSEIHRSLEPDFKNSLLIAKVDKKNLSSFTDENVDPSIYFYWVKSCNSTGCSKASSYADVIASNSSSDIIKAKVNGDAVNLSWTPDTSPSVYNIYRSTNTILDDSASLISKDNKSSVKSYADKGVSPGIYYYWLKRCTGPVCTSGGAGIKVNILNNPSIKEIKVDNGNVVLTVNEPSNASLSQSVFTYIYRDIKDNSSNPNKVATLSSGKIEHIDIVSSGDYYYWVQSCNLSGCTDMLPLKNKVTVATKPATKPTVSIDSGIPVIKTNSKEKELTYKVYRGRTSNLSSASEIGDIASNSKGGYKDSSISEPGDYYYWFKSCNSLGCSKAAGPSKITFIGKLTSNIKAIIKDGVADLSWDKINFGSKIVIYRNTSDKVGTSSKLAEVQSGVISYPDSSVVSGSTYYYWLQSCDDRACSNYSSASNKLLVPTKASSAPIISTDSSGYPVIKTDGKQSNLSFEIYRADSDDLSLASKIRDIPSNSKDGYTDSTLTKAGTYYYWFKNCTSSGCSKASSSSKISFVGKKISSKIRVIVENGIAVISWDKINFGSRIAISRNTSNDVSTSKGIAIVQYGTTSYSDDNVAAGSAYYYWLQSCDDTSCSNYSSASSEVIVPTKASSAPIISINKLGYPVIKTDGKQSNLIFKIYSANSDDLSLASKVGDISSDSKNGYKDSTLTKPGTYYYWFKNCTASGCSQAIGPQKAVFSGKIPSNLPTITTSVKDGSVNLSWTKSSVSPNYKIKLYRGDTNNNKLSKEIKELNSDAISYIDTSASAGSTYYYWLKLCAAQGTCSDYSSASSEVIVPTKVSSAPIISTDSSGYPVIKTDGKQSNLSFEIYRANSDDLSLASKVGDISSDNKNGYTDSTLTKSGTYYYWFKNCTSSGCTKAVGPATVKFKAIVVPDAPTGVKATNDSMTGEVKISWNPINSKAKTEIYRASVADLSDEKLVATIDAGVTSYADGVINGGTHYYRVKSCVVSNCSKASVSSSAVKTIARPEGKLSLGGNSYIRFGEGRLKITNSNETYSAFKSTTNDITTASYEGEVSATKGNQGSVSDGKTYYFWLKNCNKDRSICSMPSIQPSGNNYLEISVPSSPTSTLEITNIDMAKEEATFTRKGPKSDVIWLSKTTGNLFAPNTIVSLYGTVTVKLKDTKSVWLANCSSGELICSSASHITNIEKLLVPLASPTSLQAKAGDSEIDLSWNGVSGASYEIHQATETFSSISDVASYKKLSGYKTYITNATSHKITGLTNGTKYHLVVTASKNGKQSLASGEVSATPAAPAIKLPTFSIASDSPKKEGEEITFTAKLSDVLPKGYTLNIQLDNGTGGFSSRVAMSALASGTTFIHKSKTSKSGTWKYQIAIFKGTAKQTDWKEGTYTIEKVIKAPNPPTGLQVTAGDSEIDLSWTGVSGASYEIHQATETFSSISDVASYKKLSGYKTYITNATSHKITGLTNSIKYHFVVTALKNGKQSLASGEVSATPAAPAIKLPTFSITNDSPKKEGEEITFTAKLSDVLPKGYTLNIQLDNGTGGFSSRVAMSALPNGTTFIHKDKISKIGTWRYQVAIFKGIAKQTDWKEGAYTIEKIIKAPNTPTGLQATAVGSEVNLSWTGVSGASYEIHQATETFSSISDVANYSVLAGYKSYSTSVTSHKITGLTNGTKYYFVVTALKNGKQSSASNEVEVSQKIDGWKESIKKTPWGSRLGHQAVALNGRMYVIGGNDAIRYKNDTWSSDDGKNWISETSDTIVLLRFGYQAIAFNNKIYVIGGESRGGIYENDVWSTTDGKKWTEVTRSTGFPGRSYHQLVVLKNKIYVIGGKGSDGSSKSDVWSSTDGKEWTEVTKSAGFLGRYNHQAVVLNDKMYVIGGKGSDGSSKSDVWSSTDGKKWDEITKSAGFLGRYNHQAVVLNNKIYVIGGLDINRGRYNDVWSSTDGKKWDEITKSADFSARHGHQAVVFKDKIYIIGGHDGDYKSDVWYFKP